MADDWKPGDLALAIKSGIYIQAGECHYVTEVVPVNDWLYGAVGPALIFANVTQAENIGKSARGGFWCGNFLKIPPLTDEERDEFLTDLEFDLQVAERRRVRA